MRKIRWTLLIAACAISASMGEILKYDGFSGTPAASTVPDGWVSDDTAEDHASIISGSLEYTGIATSGNSFGLGDRSADYSLPVTVPTLGTNETVYMSFLMRISSLDAFNAGMIRLYKSDKFYENGIGIGIGTSDSSSNKMGFSLSNRHRNWISSESLNTAETYDITNTTYLVVGAYTRGSSGNGSGTVSLWVNPAITATPGTPTLTMASYQEDDDVDTFQIVSGGSSSFPDVWQMDEVKVGTEWSDVVSASVPSANPPVASFSADPTSGSYPLTVTFSDTSTGTVTNRTWDFGDGTTTNTAASSVEHIYSSIGSYTVEMIADGPAGSDTNTVVDLISVEEPPEGFAITSDNADARIGLNTSGEPVLSSASLTSMEIGDNYPNSGKSNACVIVMFALPDLGGESIGSANLAADLYCSYPGGNDPFPKGVDLYAIRTASTSTVSTNDYGFNGSGSGTLIADNVMTMPSQAVYDWATYETDDTADAALASWIADQYAAGAVPGDFVFFRYEVDADTANPVLLASSENTEQNVPTLFIGIDSGPTESPSPSTVSLGGELGTGSDVINWTTEPGYTYGVYWATNLMDGFQPLETNLSDSVTSLTNLTDAPAAFYKIEAE